MSDHNHDTGPARPYGLLAEFTGPAELAAATRQARAAGYRKLDAYTPYPVAEVCDAVGVRRTEIGAVMLTGGIVGGTCGFLMLCWTSYVNYPINIGGRPYISWPMFIPITFELTVLTTGLSGLFGLLALCGLPRLNHPLFNSERFERASRDRFFLCIESRDPKYHAGETRALLESFNPVAVEEVPE